MSVDWAPAVDRFAASLSASNRSEATCDGYLRHLEWLSSSVQVGPWDLTATQLGEWLDARNWSRETRRKVLVSIRAFYAWAVAEGLCEWAPTAGLPSKLARRPGPGRRTLPAAWVQPMADYLAWMQARGCAIGTLDVRRWWLGRLAEVTPDPWAVSTQQLAQWLSTPDWAPEFRRAGLSSLRSFYKWGQRNRPDRGGPGRQARPRAATPDTPPPDPRPRTPRGAGGR